VVAYADHLVLLRGLGGTPSSKATTVEKGKYEDNVKLLPKYPQKSAVAEHNID
jgi:hypothetical protein